MSLDRDTRDIPRSVGTGLGDDFPPIAEHSINDLIKNSPIDFAHRSGAQNTSTKFGSTKTISEIVEHAREQIAILAGVDEDAVNLDLKIKY